MSNSERKDGLFAAVSNYVRRLANSDKGRSASEVVFTEPLLSVIPNPLDDLDGYDRHFILRGERESYYGGKDILRGSDLDHEVLEWARTNYPNSFSTPGIRLHMIKSFWLQDDPVKLSNPDGWKELLKDDSWKQLVPPSDFDKKR